MNMTSRSQLATKIKVISLFLPVGFGRITCAAEKSVDVIYIEFDEKNTVYD